MKLLATRRAEVKWTQIGEITPAAACSHCHCHCTAATAFWAPGGETGRATDTMADELV
ncbi:hypothetical protein WEI85_34860 [Actinomycetes bacterium KLBMP 9797]